METIFFIAIALLSAFVPWTLLAKPETLPSCDVWLARTANGADKRTEKQWRDWTISSLAESCKAIPENLRDAAAQVRGVKDQLQRARILAEAATAVLGPACVVAQPLADARELAAACPLPPNLRFKVDESILLDLRAVDYALLNAMLKALIGTNQYNEEAERVMVNFALSAQIVGEDERTRGKRRAKSRP